MEPDPLLALSERRNQSPTDRLLRAHIAVLVSALGGPDHTQNPPTYRPGHDALACLKDIKRWLRAVDEQQNSSSVALACAASNLVVQDLIPILCMDQKRVARKQWHQKVALSALEVMVLLTWPLERTTPHYAELARTQLIYKKHILQETLVKNVVRLALPSLSKPRLDREPRDNAIMRLVMLFLRNVVAIEPADPSVSAKSNNKSVVVGDRMPQGVAPEDVSLSAVARVFQKAKAFMFILTVSSALGTDLDREIFGSITTEVVFFLVRGVDPSSRPRKAILDISASTPLVSETATQGLSLSQALQTEAVRSGQQRRTLQTRHGHFGTLVSLRTGNESYVISGQNAIRGTHESLDKIDREKKRGRVRFKYDADEFVRRREGMGEELLGFVGDFLEGNCFNILVDCVGGRLTDGGDDVEKAAYFQMVGWFLEYIRADGSKDGALASSLATLKGADGSKDDASSLGAGNDSKDGASSLATLKGADGSKDGASSLATEEYPRESKDDANASSLAFISSSLSEINFILLTSAIRDAFTNRHFSTLHVLLRSFHELLLISTTLFSSHSPHRDLAETVFRKLFSLQDFISLLVQIPQTAAKHSPEYLRTVVDVVHTILRAFEAFANEDVQLYVRRIRARKSETDESDDEDASASHARSVQERKLDFARTEARFFHTATVSAHITHLSRYEELAPAEIKRCLRYFHRLFVVRKDFGALFRLDFMNVLHRVRGYVKSHVKGSLRTHVDEFVCYFMKKFKVALARWPLPLELLFPRFDDPESRTFLSTGELYVRSDRGGAPKLAREVEFVREMPLDERIKVLVAAIGDRPRFWDWLEAGGVPPASVKRTFITNAYIRMLLGLVGYSLPFTMDDPVVADEVNEDIMDMVRKYVGKELEFEDGKDALFFLRVKEGDYDDDYDGYDAEDDGIAFVTEASGNRQNIHELDLLENLEEGLGKARKKMPRPKPKGPKEQKESKEPKGPREPSSYLSIKSAEFIHDSDDESDEEREKAFFAREEQLRKMLNQSGGIVNAQQLSEFKKAWARLQNDANGALIKKAAASADALFVSEEEEEENENEVPTKRRRVVVSDDE